MITFKRFYNTIRGLKSGQEAHVYADNELVAKFKVCEEFGREFLLMFNDTHEAFDVIQDAGLLSIEDRLEDYYEDFTQEADELRIDVVKTFIDKVSAHALDELNAKVKEAVGDEPAEYIIPAVCKALTEGSRYCKEEILSDWLYVDSMRVCTECGAVMEEGWYMNDAGYACSDECAAKMEGITMEQFKKWRIYKDDITEYLQLEGHDRNIDELTQDECDIIIDEYCKDCDYFWTEWY